MMEELVAALPPLGNSKVSDRVAGNRVIAAHEGVGPAGWGWSGHHGSAGGLPKVGDNMSLMLHNLLSILTLLCLQSPCELVGEVPGAGCPVRASPGKDRSSCKARGCFSTRGDLGLVDTMLHDI